MDTIIIIIIIEFILYLYVIYLVTDRVLYL